jgi:hypothetical protein
MASGWSVKMMWLAWGMNVRQAPATMRPLSAGTRRSGPPWISGVGAAILGSRSY